MMNVIFAPGAAPAQGITCRDRAVGAERLARKLISQPLQRSGTEMKDFTRGKSQKDRQSRRSFGVTGRVGDVTVECCGVHLCHALVAGLP